MTASGARSVRPTDLVALVSYDGEVYPNEALSWERLAKGDRDPHPLESAFEQWFSFATGRSTWISVKGQGIRGLLSVRRRSGRVAWEVDCLILTEEDPELLRALVERMCADATRAGVRRIFLRLHEDSAKLEAARSAGFVMSRRETLWVAEQPVPPAVADPPLRARRKEDALALFGLYNAIAPQATRGLEATTVQEWAAFQETRGFGSRVEELLFEEDGRVTGAIRLARGRSVGWLEVMCRPETRWLDALLAGGLRRLEGKRRVHALVPEHIGGLNVLLTAAGFAPGATAVTLVKRLVVTVAELEPAAVAQPAVAV